MNDITPSIIVPFVRGPRDGGLAYYDGQMPPLGFRQQHTSRPDGCYVLCYYRNALAFVWTASARPPAKADPRDEAGTL